MLKEMRLKLETETHFILPLLFLFLAVLLTGGVLLGSNWLALFWSGESLILATSVSAISCVVVLFILFNTVYYGYIMRRQSKLLISALGYLIAAVFQLVRFIGLVTTQQGINLAYTPIWSLISEFAWLFLFIVLLIAEVYPTVFPRRAETQNPIRWIPFLVTVLSFLILWVIWICFKQPAFRAHIPEIRVIIAYFICLFQLILIILTVKLYYSEANNQYMIMVASFIFFFFGASNEMIFYTGGLMSQFFVNLYMLTGFGIMLSSIYKTYIGDPMKMLQNQENQLTLYAKNLEKVISKRTGEVKEINEKFNSELEYAKSIQQSLLPEKKFVIKNVHFVTEYFPCEKLSGDFFDIYRIDEENVGMYILDVSGHGISAALMTMFSNNFIKSSEKLIMRFRGLKPHKNLGHFFEEFNKMNFPDEMYMVIFFASYNLNSQILTYCSGGMNSVPFIVRKEGEIEYLDQSEGFAICKLDGLYTPEYHSAQVRLEPGDRVVFYTDGIVDIDKNRVFDQESFEKFFTDHMQLSLKQLNERMIATIYPFSGRLEDDITYFIFEI